MRNLLPLLWAALATAAKLTITIPPSPPLLPNPATLPPSTHAVLVGPPGTRYDAPLRRDNTFLFTDLSEASYLLTIYSRDFFFPPLRVDVMKSADGTQTETIQAWQTFRGNEWSNKGPVYGTGKGELGIQIQPSSQKDFYTQRGGFNVVGFLKSPMILMGLVSVVFIFGLPKLMDNSTCYRVNCSVQYANEFCAVDPEMKAEFEEMQRKGPLTGQQSPANQLQNFDMAGWLAGRTSGDGGGKK
jgi:ER membrane protein complex subunit 7